MTDTEKKTGLDLLREPFAPQHISKLPKPTKKQTEQLRADFKLGIRCGDCGGWHLPQVVHLDYVGHAALTDRLLECDIKWDWRPVATNEDGTPRLEKDGGMWINLTVCGVTRLGYGNPDGKTGGNAIKETIGDALRNAAMRFGAALDLWHKGDLHADDDDPAPAPAPKDSRSQNWLGPLNKGQLKDTYKSLKNEIEKSETIEELIACWTARADELRQMRHDMPDWYSSTHIDQPGIEQIKDKQKAEIESKTTPFDGEE